MARIKGKDIYVKDDDQIYFGDNADAQLWYLNSELRLNHTISGTNATAGYHLIRKDQVEFLIDTAVSGTTASGTNLTAYTEADLNTPVVGKPGVGTLGPILSYLFDPTKIETVYSSYIVPEDYEPNTDITVKICSMVDSNQTGTNSVVWRIGYHVYDDTESYTSKTYTYSSVTDTLPNNVLAGYFSIATFPLLTYNDINNPFDSGKTLTFSLERVATDGNDTLTGDMAFIALVFINEKKRST